MTKAKNLIIFGVQEFFSSDTDAAAGAAATAAASAAAFVLTTVFTVVATVAAAEAAAVAAAVAAAPAAASVSEEKNSWTLNIIRFLVFVTLLLHGGVWLFKNPFSVSFSFRSVFLPFFFQIQVSIGQGWARTDGTARTGPSPGQLKFEILKF